MTNKHPLVKRKNYEKSQKEQNLRRQNDVTQIYTQTKVNTQTISSSKDFNF